MRDDEFKAEVGRRFAVARVALRLSQPAVAKLLGATQQSVSKWETGKVLVPPREWGAMCMRYGLTFSWLYEAKAVAEIDHDMMRRIADVI